jgi:hypothetical protein
MVKDKYAYKKPKNVQEELVELTLPSGNFIIMARPSKYSIMFKMQSMPATLTDKAVAAWKEKGVGSEKEIEQELLADSTPEERMELFNASINIRNDVIKLSRKPKLVFTPEAGKGELSVYDMTDIDLDYLYKWVASGGVASPALAQFRGGPKQDAVAGTDRPDMQPTPFGTGGVR